MAFDEVDGPFQLPTPMAANMTLRDYFASQALGGMHARDSYDEGLGTPQQRARIAYIDADALLAERTLAERTKEPSK